MDSQGQKQDSEQGKCAVGKRERDTGVWLTPVRSFSQAEVRRDINLCLQAVNFAYTSRSVGPSSRYPWNFRTHRYDETCRRIHLCLSKPPKTP